MTEQSPKGPTLLDPRLRGSLRALGNDNSQEEPSWVPANLGHGPQQPPCRALLHQHSEHCPPRQAGCDSERGGRSQGVRESAREPCCARTRPGPSPLRATPKASHSGGTDLTRAAWPSHKAVSQQREQGWRGGVGVSAGTSVIYSIHRIKDKKHTVISMESEKNGGQNSNPLR